MSKYLFRRLLMMVPLILGISILTFSILKLAPGDPSTLSVNFNASIALG